MSAAAAELAEVSSSTVDSRSARIIAPFLAKTSRLSGVGGAMVGDSFLICDSLEAIIFVSYTTKGDEVGWRGEKSLGYVVAF